MWEAVRRASQNDDLRGRGKDPAVGHANGTEDGLRTRLSGELSGRLTPVHVRT